MAFDGNTKNENHWSPDRFVKPPYWIQWNAPSADTIQIQQDGYEHKFATLTYSTYSCKLDMKRRKVTMLTFKLVEVCTPVPPTPAPPTPASRTPVPPMLPDLVWRLTSDNELYWNLGEVILLRNGVRVNEHANCTASSEYSTTPCSMAFDGITAQDRFSRWSPDWNVENPPYWIQWDAPSADTIQNQQTSHEHTFATLTYSTYSCKLDMKRLKDQLLTFKLAEVCP